MNARDLLELEKARDGNNIGVVTLLTQEKLYERLTSVWPNVARLLARDVDPMEECPEDTPTTHRLRWLWARVEPAPEPLWADVAGVPFAPHVVRAMSVLQDNCVVFPDGTISQWAQRYLNNQAVRAGALRSAEADEVPDAL